jgi:hypothetical protein
MSVFTVDEKTAPTHTFTVTDEDDNAVQPTSLALTYYDRTTGDIINSRNAQDVLNANDVAVTNGIVVWSMQEADTTLVGAASDRGEIHVAEWDWVANSKRARHRTIFRIVNYEKVT